MCLPWTLDLSSARCAKERQTLPACSSSLGSSSTHYSGISVATEHQHCCIAESAAGDARGAAADEGAAAPAGSRGAGHGADAGWG